MKKLIPCAMLLIIATATFSQQTKPSTTLTKQDYLQKSKKQKTAAWILLGGGAALTVTGLVVGVNELYEGTEEKFYVGGVILLTGLAATVASIPLFIASGKNKKKAAASVSFKMEKTTMISQWAVTNKRYPAVVVQFRL